MTACRLRDGERVAGRVSGISSQTAARPTHRDARQPEKGDLAAESVAHVAGEASG